MNSWRRSITLTLMLMAAFSFLPAVLRGAPEVYSSRDEIVMDWAGAKGKLALLELSFQEVLDNDAAVFLTPESHKVVLFYSAEMRNRVVKLPKKGGVKIKFRIWKIELGVPVGEIMEIIPGN